MGSCQAHMTWIPQLAMRMAMKGMKGMCKGKGKADAGQNQQPRPCATEGCSFQATWHPTHCCHGCASKGATCHGPKCERRQVGDGVEPSADGNFLTPRMMASVVTCMLPKILPHLAQESPRLGYGLQMAMAHVPQLRGVLQALKPLLEKTHGLEHCVGPLESALQGNAESAGNFALSLATGLDVLPFDQQIAFLEAAHAEHWSKIQELASHAPFLFEHWQHRQVHCDGCQASPLKGPRFKCKSCDNYDLCGECFAKKNTLNGGRCAEHKFECMVADFEGVGFCPGMFGRGMWGKGMFGKGPWGKGERGKGKGKCKDTTFGCLSSQADQPATEAPNDEPVAPTNAGDKVEIDDSQERQKTQKQEDTDDPDVQPKPSRFAIPVMLDDGRELIMEWEAGADLQQIATAWALQHDIPEEMVPQLVDFAQMLSK